MKTCPQCRAVLRPGARYCPACGLPLEDQAAAAARVSARPVHDGQRAERPQAPLRPASGLAIAWSVVSGFGWLFAWIGTLLYLGSGSHVSHSEREEILSASVPAMIFSSISVLLYALWLYRAWRAVPPEHRETTPGQAVGLLFVPVFNLYWLFRAHVGLSRSIERALAGRVPAAEARASRGLAIATCVITLIPYVNFVSWLLFVVWVNRVNIAKNRMIRAVYPGENGEASN